MSLTTSHQERERCGRRRRLERQITSSSLQNNNNNGNTPTHLDYRVWWDTYYQRSASQSTDIFPPYYFSSPSVYDTVAAAAVRLLPPQHRSYRPRDGRCPWERAPALKSTGTHKRLEEEEEYTQAYAYTQACGSCRPRAAERTQKDLTLLCCFYIRGVWGLSVSPVVHAPLGACRGFDTIGQLLHAGSSMISCATPVIHAPLGCARDSKFLSYMKRSRYVGIVHLWPDDEGLIPPKGGGAKFQFCWELRLLYAPD